MTTCTRSCNGQPRSDLGLSGAQGLATSASTVSRRSSPRQRQRRPAGRPRRCRLTCAVPGAALSGPLGDTKPGAQSPTPGRVVPTDMGSRRRSDQRSLTLIVGILLAPHTGVDAEAAPVGGQDLRHPSTARRRNVKVFCAECGTQPIPATSTRRGGPRRLTTRRTDVRGVQVIPSRKSSLSCPVCEAGGRCHLSQPEGGPDDEYREQQGDRAAVHDRGAQ
jgi:hypothetical protein